MLHVLDASLGYGLVPRQRARAGVRLRQRRRSTALITAVVLRYLYVDRRLAGAGARQRARRGRCAAGADQAAFPVQQHEHHRRPGAHAIRWWPSARCWTCPTCSAPRWAPANPTRRLAEEVELAERYLAIEALRLGDAPAGAPGAAPSRCPGACRCRAWCCSRWWRTRCCTASRGCRRAARSRSTSLPMRGDLLRCACATRRRRPRERDAGSRRRAARPAQHRPAPGLCLRPARADDGGVGRRATIAANSRCRSPGSAREGLTAGMKVVIADDEPLARERLRELLAEHARASRSSPRPATAARRCTPAPSTSPDLVLLDIAMPGIDGLEAARHLAAFEPRPAVVFCTAYDAHALSAFEAAGDRLPGQAGARRAPGRRARARAHLRRRPRAQAPAAPQPGSAAPTCARACAAACA